MAISAVDLALWDLIGKVREEPVFSLIGGLSRDEITFYCTGPAPDAVKDLGFWGAKVPLPHGHFDGEEGLRKNVEYLAAQRNLVGPGYPLMVDCYMSLTVPYAIRLAEACKHLDVYWWEEVLTPDDIEGFRLLKQAHPGLKWTTGEHVGDLGFGPVVVEKVLVPGNQLDRPEPRAGDTPDAVLVGRVPLEGPRRCTEFHDLLLALEVRADARSGFRKASRSWVSHAEDVVGGIVQRQRGGLELVPCGAALSRPLNPRS